MKLCVKDALFFFSLAAALMLTGRPPSSADQLELEQPEREQIIEGDDSILDLLPLEQARRKPGMEFRGEKAGRSTQHELRREALQVSGRRSSVAACTFFCPVPTPVSDIMQSLLPAGENRDRSELLPESAGYLFLLRSIPRHQPRGVPPSKPEEVEECRMPQGPERKEKAR